MCLCHTVCVRCELYSFLVADMYRKTRKKPVDAAIEAIKAQVDPRWFERRFIDTYIGMFSGTIFNSRGHGLDSP